MKIEDLPKEQRAIAHKIVKILEPFTPDERKTLIGQLRERLEPKLLLMRVDNGDWSLHPPVGTIKAQSEVPMLMSGPARKVGDGWDRPTAQDFDHAWRMYQEHLARSKTHEQGQEQPQSKTKKRKKSATRG